MIYTDLGDKNILPLWPVALEMQIPSFLVPFHQFFMIFDYYGFFLAICLWMVFLVIFFEGWGWMKK